MQEEQNTLVQEAPEQSPAPKKAVKKKPPHPAPKKGTAPKKNTKKPKRKKNTGRASQILAVLVVLLAFYLVISLFVAGLILYSFYDTADNTEIYSLNIIYGEKKIFSMDAEDANNEYGLYVPFSQLAEIGAFGLAGDGDEFAVFIIGTDNRIEGTVNSSLVVINDNPVRISSPIVYDSENNEYMIPIVLIENYINGIDVTYDDEQMICKVSSDNLKTDVSLKLLLPQGMPNAYFPDSFKYYGTESSEATE